MLQRLSALRVKVTTTWANLRGKKVDSSGGPTESTPTGTMYGNVILWIPPKTPANGYAPSAVSLVSIYAPTQDTLDLATDSLIRGLDSPTVVILGIPPTSGSLETSVTPEVLSSFTTKIHPILSNPNKTTQLS